MKHSMKTLLCVLIALPAVADKAQQAAEAAAVAYTTAFLQGDMVAVADHMHPRVMHALKLKVIAKLATATDAAQEQSFVDSLHVKMRPEQLTSLDDKAFFVAVMQGNVQDDPMFADKMKRAVVVVKQSAMVEANSARVALELDFPALPNEKPQESSLILERDADNWLVLSSSH